MRGSSSTSDGPCSGHAKRSEKVNTVPGAGLCPGTIWVAAARAPRAPVACSAGSGAAPSPGASPPLASPTISISTNPSATLTAVFIESAGRLPHDRPAADRAMRLAYTRPQQAQVVVDLGDGSDRRARVARGGLLVDRDRRREALDRVDVGLVHLTEELPRVGRQRLHVAPL